ncbi:MAG: hypothetical protein ACHQET_00495 [Chitinophagales bacterium]
MSPIPKKAPLYLLICLSFLGGFQQLSAQLKSSELKEFRSREDSMKRFANDIVQANEPEQRFMSDSIFIRMLVRTLRLKNSFYYPFDSLETISRIYSPDSVFRIFTWQVKKDEDFYLQQGAIQMRTPDGSLKLTPLHDASTFSSRPQDSIRTANNWIGAIYYRIVLKEYDGKKIYTMLGFDDFSISSKRKWMEILTFNDRGEPVFGGPYISFKDDSATSPKKPFLRFNIEYKKEAAAKFNYDPEMDMIVYDQLVSESEEPDRKSSYVPDGDFEGFKWKDGLWVHTGKVFDFQLKDGQFPQDEKILDDAGKPNEQKLMEQSDKNQKKQSTTNPKK